MNFDCKENGGEKAFLAVPKHEYRLSQLGEHDCSAKSQKMEIITRIQVCLVWWMNFNFMENVDKKLFLTNQSINIMYPNKENMIVIPNNKRNKDYYENPSLSDLMDEFWLRKMLERELFLPNQSTNIIYPNKENMIVVPNHKKKMKIITTIQVCLIWGISTSSKQNGGKKSFSCQTKTSLSCILIRRTCLWCTITNGMEIIMRIQVCLIGLANFDSKENGGKMFFFPN